MQGEAILLLVGVAGFLLCTFVLIYYLVISPTHLHRYLVSLICCTKKQSNRQKKQKANQPRRSVSSSIAQKKNALTRRRRAPAGDEDAASSSEDDEAFVEEEDAERLAALGCFDRTAARLNGLLNRPTHLLQIFYLLLVFGGYITKVSAIYSYLSAFEISLSIFLMVITLLTYHRCCVADPGVLSRQNVARYRALYPYDGYLYVARRCVSCEVEKVARSKHCSVCERCVARFDHHCPWVNNCVGERNLRFFLGFLYLTAILCMYTCYLCVRVMRETLFLARFWERRYVDVDGELKGLGYVDLTQFLGVVHPGAFALMMFTGLTSLVLTMFASYHLWLVCRGITSNETFKQQDMLKLIQYRRLLEQEAGLLPEEAEEEESEADVEEPESAEEHQQGKRTNRQNAGQQTKQRRTKKQSESNKQKKKRVVVNYFEDHDAEAVAAVFAYGADERSSTELEKLSVAQRQRFPYDHGWRSNLVRVLLPPKL